MDMRLRLVSTFAASLTLLLATASASAIASGLYGGLGGLHTSFDEAEDDAQLGLRVYGGYDFLRVPMTFRLGLEGGYTRTGSFETNGVTRRQDNGDVGIQGTLTALGPLNLHARIAQEFGDSEGMMFAVGGSIAAFPLTRIRADYQIRNDFDAAMLSVEIRLP